MPLRREEMVSHTSPLYLCVCVCVCVCVSHMACKILVPWPGIELMPPAVEVRSPNHGTTKGFPLIHPLMLTSQQPLWDQLDSCWDLALTGEKVDIRVPGGRCSCIPFDDPLSSTLCVLLFLRDFLLFLGCCFLSSHPVSKYLLNTSSMPGFVLQHRPEQSLYPRGAYILVGLTCLFS